MIGAERLAGTLTLPQNRYGLVIFAHGSGSSRLSPRNTLVARQLNDSGLATLLFDLLTDEEAQDRRNVFDIPLLGSRVINAINWVSEQEDLARTPIGVFGASTGAAAALVAAAQAPGLVKAVVSRGGRPDLAGQALGEVRAPTLLIVGGNDYDVLELNRAARKMMRCETELSIIPGATHLFEEEGAMDQVVSKASAWFMTHLSGAWPRTIPTDEAPR
ncbi:dienelactone hydrolase family protein [Microvirga flavescens]|uniref:dienelactone hydrolase family protein n=1 Tax=Microvirga flavescens TaxID=2249811 RepID=UPI001FDEED55|nr:alpha/beta family hydrolase [Microvirga flavescens]